MCNSGSTLTVFDPKIEITAQAIWRVVREATIAQRILVEDHSLISSEVEEEITMTVVPLPTMGDYYKRKCKWHVSRGSISTNLTNFDIKHYMLSGLRDNPFDENIIRCMWEHLARFYETTLMYKPVDVTEDHVKLRLFRFRWLEEPKIGCFSFQIELFRHGKRLRIDSYIDSSPPLSLLSE